MLRDYLLPHFGRMVLENITKRDVVAFQGNLIRGLNLGNKSVNTLVGTLHKMFSDAVDWEYLETNPVKGIKQLKCPDLDYSYWTIEERDRFLEFAKARNSMVHDLVAFSVFTGLRRGEVQGLLRDCLDFERQMITVKRSYCSQTAVLRPYTKGKTIRVVPMNRIVLEVLGKFKDFEPQEAVFKVDFQNFVRRLFQPMQKEAGVRVITFHDLRHSFASHMIMKGVSVFEVQKLLGHAEIQTTMRYAHLIPDHLRGVTDKLLD